MKKNEFIKKLIRRSNYMDKLVYVKVDGGRREIIKLKPKKKKYYNSLEYYRDIKRTSNINIYFEIW
ncbi:hypothetical protein BF344P1_00039 [Bacteroides phage BF344P1]|nr:hypothetical protein BF344P1_00039 [Bacteroides phage BF344P1]